MDLPATQAMNDEDLVPTQQFVTEDREHEKSLVGTLFIENTQHSIFSGITTVGRLPFCKIVLNDETVSKKHAEIEAESADKAIFIKDLGSCNRTKINDTKLRPNSSYQIRNNDKLSFGKITATFKIYQAVDDSLVSCTPQVNRKAIIPGTPDSSMNNSSILDGDVSTIPGTQTDEDDSCFRRPKIPVRTSISNEHQSPKHESFTLDDLPSPLSNLKDKDNDISEVETQRFTANDTKEVPDNSIHPIETQLAGVSRSSTNVKKILSKEFENQSMTDAETQPFLCAKSECSRKSENASIYNAETQKPDTLDDHSIEDFETQPYMPVKPNGTQSNSADVSIHSAITQKNEATEDELINKETQPFSLNSFKRKSANASIHSAETQKLIADISNQSIENIETQRFVSSADFIDPKSANDSIHSAATQKAESTSENEAIENLETQQFDITKSRSISKRESNIASTSNMENENNTHEASENQSVENAETQPFVQTKIDSLNKSNDQSIYSAPTQKITSADSNDNDHANTKDKIQKLVSDHSVNDESQKNIELDSSDNGKIDFYDDGCSKEQVQAQVNISRTSQNNKSQKVVEVHNTGDVSFGSDINTTKTDSDDEVGDSDDENNKGNSDSEVKKLVSTSLKKSYESKSLGVNGSVMQNQEESNKNLSALVSKNLPENSSRFDHPNNIVESDDEEIFSQNLIESVPFPLLLDESKNDVNEQTTNNLQKDTKLENKQAEGDNVCHISSKKGNDSINEGDKKLKNNASANLGSDDSETDEEGTFSSHLTEEKSEQFNSKPEVDSETDEEGTFSSHLTEEKSEKSNSKPEVDSETDEEGVFSGHLTKDSKEKSSVNSGIINESESEDEGIPSSNLSSKKASKESESPVGSITKITGSASFVNQSKESSLNKQSKRIQSNLPTPDSDDDIFDENHEEKENCGPSSDIISNACTNEGTLNSRQSPLIQDNVRSKPILNNCISDNEDVDELAPTQIVETNDFDSDPTQIINTCWSSNLVEKRTEEFDELAPTQLIETQDSQLVNKNPSSTLAHGASRHTDQQEEVQRQCDDMGLAPTQKMEETQQCIDSLAPTQKMEETQQCIDSLAPTQKMEETQQCIDSLAPTQKMEETQQCIDSLAPTQKVDTQLCSEEMPTLQFTESLDPTQIVERGASNLETEITKTAQENIPNESQTCDENQSKISSNISKRQLEEIEITTNKKLKTVGDLRKVELDLNSTIEKNLNEMFEGSEERSVNVEPIETQQLENILESSQIEENSSAALNVSFSQPSPTLSTRRSAIRSKNRRRALMLNKSESLNDSKKSVVNLNDTIEKNLNELFDNSVDVLEKHEPEPMLTQQLENVLTSSQESNPMESKAEDRSLSVSRRKSRLSLSMNLNNSMLKTQQEESKLSSLDVQSTSKVIEVSAQNNLNKTSTENEDYCANFDNKKHGTDNQKILDKNDREIVYRRGTIGFTDDLQAVSTFDRVAFLDKYSTSDSQSDVDDIMKLRTPKAPSSKKRVSLSLKSVDLNSSLSSSTSDQDVEKKEMMSPALSSKKVTKVHQQSSRKRIPIVRLSKLASPIYRKYMKKAEVSSVRNQNHVKPAKRVLARGTIGFTDDLQPVESEELVSAASTESEDDLRAQVRKSNPSKITNDDNTDQLTMDLPTEDDKNDSEDEFLKALPEVKIAGTANCPATFSSSDHETDTESIKSIKFEMPKRWKWYAEKRYDLIYEQHCAGKKKGDNSESENDENEEVQKENVSVNLITDNRDEQRAAIAKILAEVEAGKGVKKHESKRGARQDSDSDNEKKVVEKTRSRKLNKSDSSSTNQSEDDEVDNDKTKTDLSSSSDSDSSEEPRFLPKYRPVSPFRIRGWLPSRKQKTEDEDDSEQEFETLRRKCQSLLDNTTPKTSPKNTLRRRKSACDVDVTDLKQRGNNADNRRKGNSNVGTVDKDGLVFQVPRDLKAATTSRTTSRTKRATEEDDNDDDSSAIQPSPKRTKTEANSTKLQRVTVVISPLRDKILKLREANRLNVANALSNFKQPVTTLANKRVTRAPTVTLDNHVAISKTTRLDSSDLSVVESSIVEDKSESKNITKTRGRPPARNKKAKVVDTSSKRSANFIKENLEESDAQKPKTRGRGRKKQVTESSVSDSSKDEISASSVENKSTRSTRGKLVRQNQTKKEEAEGTINESKVIPDSDSEVSEEPKVTNKNNTRGRPAKTIKSDSKKSDIATDNNTVSDKNRDKKDSDSQSSSQSESVSTRTTRARRVNQESDSASSEASASEAATTRGNTRRQANNKPKIVLEKMEVENKESMTSIDETKNNQSKVEQNVFRLIKKKIDSKSEEPTPVPARKTRTRAAKTAVVEESSSEESQEVSQIMQNSVLEKSNTNTRRRGRPTKNNSSHVENTESSDDVFEKPTARPKRARLAKVDKNSSSQTSDAEESLKPTQSSRNSTVQKKHSPSPSPTPLSDNSLTPSRISRLSISPSKRPKVLFTGERSDVHRQILKKLGGIETEECDISSVLITDKVRRTFKFLCSVSRGIPIVSIKWLDDSNKAGRFLDLEEYILKDPEAEAKFKFNLKESLDKARQRKLLEGYSVILAPKIKQPPIAELKEMVVSSGGKALLRGPAKWPEKSIVITTEQELDSTKKLIAKAPKSVTVHSTEFILTGILRQSINLNEFKLLG